MIAIAFAGDDSRVRWVSAALSGSSIGVLCALVGCDSLPGGSGGADAAPQAGARDSKGKSEGARDQAADDGVASAEDDGGSDDAADRSRVAWHVKLASVPRAVAVTDRGTVFVLGASSIEGFVDGKPAWKKEGTFNGFTRLVDGGVATTTGNAIVAFDPSSGEDRFRVEVPAPAGWPTANRKGEPIPPPAIVAAASVGSQLLVADQEARFFEVDAPACTKGEEACIRPAGQLDGEVLEVGTRMHVADDGTRYLLEEDTLRVFDPSLETVLELESPGRISAVVPIGAAGLAIATHGQVALLQMQRCLGASLSLPGVATGSRQCFRWRYGIDLDDAVPAVIDEQTLAVNGGGRMQAVSEGTDVWKSPIGAVGSVIAGGDGLLYTMTVRDDAESTVAVEAVHPTKGTVAWSVPLPFGPTVGAGENATDVVTPETLGLDTRGGFLAAALEQNIALVTIPVEGS